MISLSPNVIVSTTQDHLEIEDVDQDLVVLKNGAAACLLQVSAINFGLLSEEEQDATIYAYASLLNSLSFPVQIVIKSENKDISGYLESLAVQEKKLKDPVLKNRLQAYRQFIEDTIVQQKVLDKKFYVIIPYQAITLTPIATAQNKEGLIKAAATDLAPKREHLIKQFNRIGLTATPLNSQSILKLLYSYYNPDSKGQKFSGSKDYSTPIVAPNVPDPLPPTP